MSDLDVIREARDYLAGLIETSEVVDPAPWKSEVYRSGQAEERSVRGFSVTADDGSIMPDTASLIVALRAAAPLLIETLESATAWQEDESMYSCLLYTSDAADE